MTTTTAALPADRSGRLRAHRRDAPPRTVHRLESAGIHPLLAQLYAARGVQEPQEVSDDLNHLLPPQQLRGIDRAAQLLADAIQARQAICVVADYDCDGATACAVALRGLRLLGLPASHARFVVPDRSVHGYGLSPTIVDWALERNQDLPLQVLVTVDNGIASVEGVAHARHRGLKVVVTDHHLPGDTLPDADVIVNPNQPHCPFPSKHLAGVGVMFYVLLAVRAELRQRGAFEAASQPRLDTLLDLVALGTVADVVRLDANNRRLVAQGLRRIRSGRMHAGVAALLAIAGRQPLEATAQDFGFALGPRINAAGRLSDMTLGIECLLTDDPLQAQALARQLDQINRERRTVEDGMRQEAERQLQRWSSAQGTQGAAAVSPEVPPAVVLFDPSFHEGVVGIVAGRVKESLHRPTFVFAQGQDGLLKGSGRSIEGFHLRDALDLVSKRHPDLLLRFGGHAMAAGCTVRPESIEQFREAFLQVASEGLTPDTLERRVAMDGRLDRRWLSVDAVRLLAGQVWGQGFEPPQFCERWDVLQQRIVGEKHLKLRLRPHADASAPPCDAIWFQRTDPVSDAAWLVYRLEVNRWQDREQVQLVIVAEAALP